MRLGVEAALDRQLVPGDVEVADGRIALRDSERQRPRIASPGFVDLQVNGFGGVDFAAADIAGYAARARRCSRRRDGVPADA